MTVEALVVVILACFAGAQAQTAGQSCTIANLTPWPVLGSIMDYFMCVDGSTVQMTCPSGTLFIADNTNVFGCVPSSQVTCSYNPNGVNNNYWNNNGNYPNNNGYYPNNYQNGYYPNNNYQNGYYPSNNNYPIEVLPNNNYYPNNYSPNNGIYPGNYQNGYYPNSYYPNEYEGVNNNNGYTTVYVSNPNGNGNSMFGRNAKPKAAPIKK